MLKTNSLVVDNVAVGLYDITVLGAPWDSNSTGAMALCVVQWSGDQESGDKPFLKLTNPLDSLLRCALLGSN